MDTIAGSGHHKATLVFGPSKITETTMMEAYYNYSLLWIIIIAIFFMIVFNNISARIGPATEMSLLTVINKKWGKMERIAVGLGVFLVTCSFQAGNSTSIVVGKFTKPLAMDQG